MPRISVVLVEDDRALLQELCVLLADSPRLDVVGSYTTGRDAIKEIAQACPDVALIDLGLPDLSGVELIRYLTEAGCKTECLVLTVYDDDAHLFPALQAGAVGYIVKNDASLPEIVRAIEEVRQGGAPMSVGIARRILQEVRQGPRHAGQLLVQSLTKRELEILEQSAQGFTTKKVAEALCISYEAVRSHQKNIYRKLRVHSLVEAVAVFRGERRG